MAERRMFAKTIIDSDEFLDMPSTARLLYYDLGMRADDDGFINSPKKIMRMTGASDGDMRNLLEKKFVIPFDTGIVVIRHWKINNYIRNDRYSATQYKNELKTLGLDENNAYIQDNFGIPNDIPVVNKRETQDRIGKDRLGKDRLGKDNKTIVVKNDDENKKITLSEQLESRIKEYTSNSTLIVALEQFIEHRRTIKKPIKTLYTLNLILKELDKHCDKIEVINQSIRNGWQGLFEVKKSNSKESESNIFTQIGRDEGLW